MRRLDIEPSGTGNRGGGEKKRRRWRQRLLLLSPSFSPWLFALADHLQSFIRPPLPHSSCHLILLCYSFFPHLVILLLHSLSCVAFKRWWMWPSYKHVNVNIMLGFFFFTAYFRPIRALLLERRDTSFIFIFDYFELIQHEYSNIEFVEFCSRSEQLFLVSIEFFNQSVWMDGWWNDGCWRDGWVDGWLIAWMDEGNDEWWTDAQWKMDGCRGR